VCNISSNQVEEERKQLLQHGTGYLGVSLHKYLLEDEESFKDEDPIAIFKQFSGDWDESLLKEKQLFLSDPRMQEPSVIDYDEDGQNETNISTALDSNTYVGDEKENERNQVEERNRDLRISPFLMNAPHEYHKLDINKISNIKYHHQIVVRTDYDNWVDTLRGNIIGALNSPIIMGGRMTILDLYDELNQRYVHMLIKGKEVVIVDPCPVDSGETEKNRLPSRFTDEIMRNIDANLVSRRVLINYSSNEVQQSGTGGGWATLIDYNKQDQENGISYEVREEGLGSKLLEPMLQEGAGYFGIAQWKYLIENSKSDTLASEELVLDFIKHWNGIDQEKRESFLDQLDNMEIGNELVEQWLDE